MPRRRKRAFSYHAGVTLDGTQLTCDAAGFATDLVFLSHAKALAPGSSFSLSSRRAGRRQLLATEGTLVLLGAAGERLRARTLPAGFGRAFNLGGLRLALVPAGYLPGAASLLCEAGGRRLLYAGTICRERAFASLGPAEPRQRRRRVPGRHLRGSALCAATARGGGGDAAAVRRGGAGRAACAGPARVPLRPGAGDRGGAAGCRHRCARARHHRGGAGPLCSGWRLPCRRCVALRENWVRTRHCSGRRRRAGRRCLARLIHRAFAFVSGFSVERTAVDCMRADQGIALSNQAGFADLVAYLEATGAHEVALAQGIRRNLRRDPAPARLRRIRHRPSAPDGAVSGVLNSSPPVRRSE